MRLHHTDIKLDTRLIESGDTRAALTDFAPESNRVELEQTGRTEFEFEFQPGARFSTSVVEQSGQLALVLTRFSTEL